MALVKRPRLWVIVGTCLGGFALGLALGFEMARVTVAFCGVLWGSTLTLAVLTLRGYE